MIIIECYKKFFLYFNRNKKNFIKYSVLSFVVGVLELFGVALTYPFVMKMLANESAQDIFHSPIFIGVCIVVLFLLKNVFMIYYSYLQANLTKAIEKEVNLKFVNCFLSDSYQEVSKISIADKNNILNFLIPNTINNFILRLLNMNVNIFIFAFLSLLLIVKFPIAMAITLAFALILIVVQNKIYKPALEEIAQKSNKTSAIFSQKENEILLNIKSLKISHNEKFFFHNYKNAITDFYKVCTKTSFLSTIPPYVVEPFVIILLFILLSIITFQNYTEPNKLIASIAIIVSAIFRLAPTIARIQVNLNGINSAITNVENLLNWCERLNLKNVAPLKEPEFATFEHNLELKNVCFEYEKSKPVLKNINLTINKGEFVGIAGLSGSGKTTLIDIIASLLAPNSGEILVDGKAKLLPLKIGYVPQEISLINGNIRENVAFGSNEIDDAKVLKALKSAQLYDFIVANYPEGIYANPFVDATGFSQGQKQRLAIARALYAEPDILMLDEATSALDLKTEDEICADLLKLHGKMTIIAIAHRLSTIKSADKIVFMKNSEIVDISEFNDLVENNADFRELVRLASIKEL